MGEVIGEGGGDRGRNRRCGRGEGTREGGIKGEYIHETAALKGKPRPSVRRLVAHSVTNLNC